MRFATENCFYHLLNGLAPLPPPSDPFCTRADSLLTCPSSSSSSSSSTLSIQQLRYSARDKTKWNRIASCAPIIIVIIPLSVWPSILCSIHPWGNRTFRWQTNSLTRHLADHSPDKCTCRRYCDLVILSANRLVSETSRFSFARQYRGLMLLSGWV